MCCKRAQNENANVDMQNSDMQNSGGFRSQVKKLEKKRGPSIMTSDEDMLYNNTVLECV